MAQYRLLPPTNAATTAVLGGRLRRVVSHENPLVVDGDEQLVRIARANPGLFVAEYNKTCKQLLDWLEKVELERETTAAMEAGQEPNPIPSGLFKCPVEGCEKFCTTERGLAKHMKAKHPADGEAAVEETEEE